MVEICQLGQREFTERDEIFDLYADAVSDKRKLREVFCQWLCFAPIAAIRHQRMQQENPDAIAEMSPASQDIYQRWIQALQQMDTQFGENAEIGKTGVRGVSAAE